MILFSSYIHFNESRCKVCRELDLTRVVVLPNELEEAREHTKGNNYNDKSQNNSE